LPLFFRGETVRVNAEEGNWRGRNYPGGKNTSTSSVQKKGKKGKPTARCRVKDVNFLRGRK